MAQLINMLSSVITLLVFIYILSTWVFPPYHSFRRSLASLVEPMLNPIRRIIPPVGMFDFSPFILLVLVQVIAMVLIQFLSPR
jgi:YggT family protein